MATPTSPVPATPVGSAAHGSRGERLARLADYWAIVYKRTWKGSVISSFVTPLLYVVAMGVVLGGFVKADPARLDGATSYLAYVAPGLLAAQSMITAFGECTYPVMGQIKWNKNYFGMIATPLDVTDVMVAHLAFVLFRVLTGSAVFVLVLALFGVFSSPVGTVVALLAQLLIGLAFAAPIYALSAGLKSESAFSLVYRLGLIPLFLFSGAFFPITNLSPWMADLARVTPLWHAVDLTRMLTLGRVDLGLALVHVVYLLALSAVGLWLGRRRLARRLML